MFRYLSIVERLRLQGYGQEEFEALTIKGPMKKLKQAKGMEAKSSKGFKKKCAGNAYPVQMLGTEVVPISQRIQSSRVMEGQTKLAFDKLCELAATPAQLKKEFEEAIRDNNIQNKWLKEYGSDKHDVLKTWHKKKHHCKDINTFTGGWPRSSRRSRLLPMACLAQTLSFWRQAS